MATRNDDEGAASAEVVDELETSDEEDEDEVRRSMSGTICSSSDS